jgi:hypothetical protein
VYRQQINSSRPVIMAGDWIKMRGNLWDDPRVARLCDETNQHEATVIGGLYWLWATADQHTEDGILHGMTLRAIDRKTGIAGFGDALVAIGWVADHPEGVRIVNFEEHNGSSAKKRALTARRVASHRSCNAPIDADEPASCAPVTQQALHNANAGVTGALAREEKRREEISPTTDVVGERAAKPRPTRKCPADFLLTDAMRAWAAEHAPLVNIDQATAAFRDHTFKTAMTDWAGAWRNWLRRDQQYAAEKQKPMRTKASVERFNEPGYYGDGPTVRPL